MRFFILQFFIKKKNEKADLTKNKYRSNKNNADEDKKSFQMSQLHISFLAGIDIREGFCEFGEYLCYCNCSPCEII